MLSHYLNLSHDKTINISKHEKIQKKKTLHCGGYLVFRVFGSIASQQKKKLHDQSLHNTTININGGLTKRCNLPALQSSAVVDVELLSLSTQ